MTGLGAGDDRFFAVGNGANTRLWYWLDGTNDGAVGADELASVADLAGVNQNDFIANNFADFNA